MTKSLNLDLLNEEMYYEPSWYIDQFLFYELLNASKLTKPQYLEIARLHIKYRHILHRPAAKKSFAYLLSKTKCLNILDLYNLTKILYKNNNLNETKI